jgi:hypothetical protein
LLPYLYAAAAKLAAIERSESVVGSPLAPRIADAGQWIDQSRDVARRLMNAITYPPLARENPLLAAKNFLDEILDLDGSTPSPTIDWQFGEPASAGDSASDAQGQPIAENRLKMSSGRLAEPTAIALYRLTTELVRNAVRHAHASKINISQHLTENAICITIKDDGCGFDPAAVASEHNHGLSLAYSRAVIGNVDLQIRSSAQPDSTIHHGTIATLTAPLQRPLT